MADPELSFEGSDEEDKIEKAFEGDTKSIAK